VSRRVLLTDPPVHVDVRARGLDVYTVEMPVPLLRDADRPDGCRSNGPLGPGPPANAPTLRPASHNPTPGEESLGARLRGRSGGAALDQVGDTLLRERLVTAGQVRFVCDRMRRVAAAPRQATEENHVRADNS
jgi:hypothetical protein